MAVDRGPGRAPAPADLGQAIGLASAGQRYCGSWPRPAPGQRAAALQSRDLGLEQFAFEQHLPEPRLEPLALQLLAVGGPCPLTGCLSRLWGGGFGSSAWRTGRSHHLQWRAKRCAIHVVHALTPGQLPYPRYRVAAWPAPFKLTADSPLPAQSANSSAPAVLPSLSLNRATLWIIRLPNPSGRPHAYSDHRSSILATLLHYGMSTKRIARMLKCLYSHMVLF